MPAPWLGPLNNLLIVTECWCIFNSSCFGVVCYCNRCKCTYCNSGQYRLIPRLSVGFNGVCADDVLGFFAELGVVIVDFVFVDTGTDRDLAT